MIDTTKALNRKAISQGQISNILGIEENTPITIDSMAKQLKFTVFESGDVPERTQRFIASFINSACNLGITHTPYQESLNRKGKISAGYSILYPITTNGSEIAIDKVSSLYMNPVIGIFDKEATLDSSATNQEKLDTIIRCLTEEIIHLAIFLGETEWTIYTMNGGVISYSNDTPIEEVLRETLVSKLTAQVVPPEILSDIEYSFGSFDTRSNPFEEIANDLQLAARHLRDHGLLMSHVKLNDINFRSKHHERIAQRYLDERSGMSYGFLVWQKPLPVKRARPWTGNSSLRKNEVIIHLDAGSFIVNVPEVSVVSTRSGCDKTDINISKDIVRMSLNGGKITVDTPLSMTRLSDCKPSYDTLTILAHSLGNYFVASILKYLYGDNVFSDSLEYKGLSLFHWHGYPSPEQVPQNLFFHGQDNPSVSCSTAQSAIYTLEGKLKALNQSLVENREYLGDVHIEPHHGVNISSVLKLEEIVKFLTKRF